MAQKKRKNKTSSVKRNNQLRTKLIKQGKLKTKRNRTKPRKISRPVPVSFSHENEEENNSDYEESAADMIEEEDISFLQNAVTNKSYLFLKDLKINGEQSKKRQKRKANVDDDDDLGALESEYVKSIQGSKETKKRKYLLPIKTSEGIVVRSEEVADNEELELVEDNTVLDDMKESKSECSNELENLEEISNADLLACRRNALMKKKFRIGILCSGLTENPEVKIKNFIPLLEMLSEKDVEVRITVKKLALMSLLEVFKDLIPGYQIKHHNQPKVKLKKTVKQLHSYENDLLRYYKEYLRKIEKMVLILKPKKGDNRVFQEPELKLAEMALNCLCDLLITHPYFNFSKNIIHLLVPFLNNGKEWVRAIVSSAIKEVFKTDKRGEMSLEIAKNINKMVKSKTSIAHSEVIAVFLSLKLTEINLDKEKEEELKRKKKEGLKHRFLRMSKRERKRNKKFQELEKELLETKAEESKKSKQQYMNEVTKMLFSIYFRILKFTPSSKLLNAALEGLAKFAHCINIEFYHDLIIVLDDLILNENLGYKEKLCCVQTVFAVLFYQGATISIDPIKFYSHFYANILQINAGRNHSDLPVVLKTTDFVLLKRRKHVSLQRLLAFTKRLTALALQVLPNGSLALLSSVKQILEVNNSTDVLLDLESGLGQGVYYPELDEPEYCNASATSLWELIPLQKHYHPTVRDYAVHLAKVGHKTQEASLFKSFLKQSSTQLFEEFDVTNVKFNPTVAPPRKFPKTKRKGILNHELKDYVMQKLQEAKLNFSNSL